MAPLLKRLGLATLVAMLGVYVYLVATGPNGYVNYQERRQRIQALEDQNAELKRQNTQRRERIRLLQESREAQELEAMKKLNKKRPHTKPFYTRPPGAVPQP